MPHSKAHAHTPWRDVRLPDGPHLTRPGRSLSSGMLTLVPCLAARGCAREPSPRAVRRHCCWTRSLRRRARLTVGAALCTQQVGAVLMQGPARSCETRSKWQPIVSTLQCGYDGVKKGSGHKPLRPGHKPRRGGRLTCRGLVLRHRVPTHRSARRSRGSAPRYRGRRLPRAGCRGRRCPQCRRRAWGIGRRPAEWCRRA